MGAPESERSTSSQTAETGSSLTAASGTSGAQGAPRKKIAYLKRGLFSFSNTRTGEQLRQHFPEYLVEEIDIVADILRRHEFVVVTNLLWVLWYYWRDLFARRQTIDLAFYRTPYIFKKIRQLVRAKLASRIDEFAFSIQTQSLYDASVPGLPHFVYTDHTHLVNLSYPGFSVAELFAPAWIDLEREIYRHAEHVFVMSHHVRKSLIEQYNGEPNRSTCVFAGSNVDPKPVAMHNDDYANQTVLFVGVDWNRKGGPTLLAAFDLVLRELPAAKLVIVGCTPEVSHPRVVVVGRVTREEVKKQMTRASLFCLPTRIEPFGIVVVEAFYHNLPVVASRIGAMPDLVAEGKTGTLVPVDQPQALASALIQLLSDPAKCRHFGESGNQFVRQNYSWNAVGEKLRRGIMATLTSPSPLTGQLESGS